MPIRIQRRRVKGWRMPPNTVSVTRPGKWSNPFKVGVGEFRDIDSCLRAYREYLMDCIDCGLLDVSEIRGKDLACFCSLEQKCHADILIEIANK